MPGCPCVCVMLICWYRFVYFKHLWAQKFKKNPANLVGIHWSKRLQLTRLKCLKSFFMQKSRYFVEYRHQSTSPDSIVCNNRHRNRLSFKQFSRKYTFREEFGSEASWPRRRTYCIVNNNYLYFGQMSTSQKQILNIGNWRDNWR